MPDDQADKAGKETPLTPEERRAVWADFHQTQEVMRRYHGKPDTHGDGPTLRGRPADSGDSNASGRNKENYKGSVTYA